MLEPWGLYRLFWARRAYVSGFAPARFGNRLRVGWVFLTMTDPAQRATVFECRGSAKLRRNIVVELDAAFRERGIATHL